MIKLIPIILSFAVFFSSCADSVPKTVSLANDEFSYDVSIKRNEKVYQYKFSYDDGAYTFTPVCGTAAVSFSFSDNKWFVIHDKYKYVLSSDCIVPLPFVVGDAIIATLDEELSSDYNGDYKHYGICDNREYCLSLNKDAEINRINIDSIGLQADFS